MTSVPVARWIGVITKRARTTWRARLAEGANKMYDNARHPVEEHKRIKSIPDPTHRTNKRLAFRQHDG